MIELYNVVFTGSFQFPEGFAGTKRIKNLIIGLKERNNCCSVLIFSNSKNNNRNGSYMDINYYTLFKKEPFLFIFYPIMYLTGLLKLIQLYDNKVAKNILYVYSGVNCENLVFILVAKMIGYKIIVDIVEDFSLSEENVSNWRSIKNKSNIFLEKKMKKLVDGIVVISSFLHSKFSLIYNRFIPVVHIPISASNIYFQPTCRPSYILDGCTNLLFSGTFGKKDGFETFLKAVEILLDKNHKIRLIITGTPNSIMQQYILSRLNDNVFFTGFLSEIEYYSLLYYCDILCVTRIGTGYANAGFPFKLGEYLASSRPVIVTNISDVSLYLENGSDAMIIVPESSDELVNKVEYILNLQDQGSQIGLNGKNKAKTFFNANNHVIELEKLFSII